MHSIGIYPEWNVKSKDDSNKWVPLYWNISRMECKDHKLTDGTGSRNIGIYPEWNVKCSHCQLRIQILYIGIYPEWNVKITNLQTAQAAAIIGIYPEWNVK